MQTTLVAVLSANWELIDQNGDLVSDIPYFVVRIQAYDRGEFRKHSERQKCLRKDAQERPGRKGKGCQRRF